MYVCVKQGKYIDGVKLRARRYYTRSVSRAPGDRTARALYHVPVTLKLASSRYTDSCSPPSAHTDLVRGLVCVEETVWETRLSSLRSMLV